jgi:hypothetical protein
MKMAADIIRQVQLEQLKQQRDGPSDRISELAAIMSSISQIATQARFLALNAAIKTMPTTVLRCNERVGVRYRRGN